MNKSLMFKDENLRGGFAQIPNIVLRDGTLSAGAVRLYALLLSYAWDNDECYPGHETLSGDMGCTKMTVIRTLEELKSRHLISWKQQGLGRPNIYYIEKLTDGYLIEPKAEGEPSKARKPLNEKQEKAITAHYAKKHPDVAAGAIADIRGEDIMAGKILIARPSQLKPTAFEVVEAQG